MMTQQAADATLDVVTGTISLFDTDAHVLVNSGATHSFISREFIERVGIEMRPTECSMVVSLPTGDSLIANRVYRGSKLTIASHEFEADLIVLDIHDFDIILGMDWLAKHRATVDCYKKEVQFSQPGELEVIFCGERKILSTSLISVIQANKMLRKACQGYLVYAIESSNSEMQLAEDRYKYLLREIGDRYKYHYVYKYLCIRISSVTPTGVLNEHKSVIRISSV